MKLKEKIKDVSGRIEKTLETFENTGNEKIKQFPDKIVELFEKKGLNNKKGIVIILAAVLAFLILTGGIFRVSFRPPYIAWVNPISSIHKAINFNIKKR